MAIKCGIVGLPNVGKSTLFNALTAAEIPAENYPFCTIEPNVGIVPVPDSRLKVLADIVNPQKTIPTTMEFVDIAGLVKGASQGEGLGNQFLANIRETNAIAHVVRCFEDDDVTHVSGSINPVDDIEIINTELALADLDSVDSSAERANPFGCPTASEMIPLCPSGRTSRISSVASSVTNSDPSERTSTKFGSPIPPSTTRVFSPSGVMRQTIPSALGPVSKRLVGPKSAIRMSRSPIGANPRLE